MSADFIDRQVFELSCSSEGTARVVRDELLHFILPGLPLIMEEVFGELTDGRKYYRIDRLEVDLGEWSIETLGRQAMMDLFKRMFKERLWERLRGNDEMDEMDGGSGGDGMVDPRGNDDGPSGVHTHQ